MRPSPASARPSNSTRNPLAHNTLGVALTEQGKPDEALVCYRKAFELDAKYGIAHYNLGNILMKEGKPDEAIACYRNAIELDPKFAMAHCNFGVALRLRGSRTRPSPATALPSRSTRNSPCPCNLGNILRDQGKLDEAIACHRNAIELDPKFARPTPTLAWL